MAKIHVLSQDTINKIAAGEVIERPMAVVKELVENAIDAGANAITVEISDGGKTLIRVTDNGCGMEKEDIKLAFLPHATSKISDITDLLEVKSLGFRGEALASIAAVSQLEMLTKTKEALVGCHYLIDGGKERELSEAGCPDGTTFLVRNLFYNTPARLKFLKTSQTEAGYIGGLLERMALSHPHISFRFINQKQQKMSTSGNGNLKDVIYHIYGRDITSNLIEIDRNEEFCTLKGFLAKPVVSRGNRAMMNYFINGRYIKSNVINLAIEQAYEAYTMQHRYPFTALQLLIDPEYLDVNVHPQKMELRFHKEREIFDNVFKGISEALKYRELIPQVTFQTKEEKVLEKREKERHEKATSFEPYEKKAKEKMMLSSAAGVAEETVLYGAVHDSGQETQKIPEKKQDSIFISKSENEIQKEALTETGENETQKEILTETGENEIQKEILTETEKNETQETLFDRGFLSEKKEKEIKIIGQVFSTYWILQYEDHMYLIDQHAAHEKVLYERFMKELENKEVFSQMLEPPVILSLSVRQQIAVEENKELLKETGYVIEAFGGKEYAVSGVPAHLPEIGTEGLLLEILDSLADECKGKRNLKILTERIASMSCKAAVKGNNRLSLAEAEELLKELMTLENPYHCPHGRPTMISVSKRELEKRFKRIV